MNRNEIRHRLLPSLVAGVLLLLSPRLAAQSREVGYEGERVEYRRHTCRVEKVGDLQGIEKHSYQGMDVWDGYMVSLQHMGYCTVYRLDKKGRPTKTGETFPLASQDELNHSNVASFTNRFLAPGDKLPLLCVTRCNLKPDTQGRDRVAYLERIDPERGTAQLVQTIWLRVSDRKIIGNPQWVVDRASGYLYAYGNTISNTEEGNQHRIMKFRMPEYRDERDSVVVLTEHDALESYLMEDYYNRPITPAIIQGADVRDGLLYLPTGVGDERRPSILYVWDLGRRQMHNVIDLQEAIPVEMEDCGAHGDIMMMHCQRSLYKITF